MNLRAFLSTLALFVVPSLVAAPHSSLPPPVIPDCLGVNIHFTDPKPGEMEMLAAAGFKWVRMDFTWAATERKKGEYDFAAYDRLAANLDQHKIRALFILDYGNPLYDDGLPPHTDESRAAFAAWAAAAVKHFAGKGHLWEMWNEPNIAQFWKPQPDVQQYIALAKTTAAALRKVAPGEAFIGPATSTIDLPFLEACFKAGLLESWAAVSVHPYRQTAPETVEEELRSVRLLIRKYAPKGKAPGDIPVISGEWGYSHVDGGEFVARQFLTNLSNDVALSIWYDWRDDGPDPKNLEHHFGLVEHEPVEGEKTPFKPKGGYTGVKILTEELRGYTFSKQILLHGDREDVRLLLFSKGATNQKLVLYSTGDEGGHVYVPATHGLFRVRDYLDRGYHHRVAAGDDGILISSSDWGIKFLTPEKPNDFLRLAAASPRLPLDFVYHWPGEKLLPLDPATLSQPYEPNVSSTSSFDGFAGGLPVGLKNPLPRKLKLISGFISPTFWINPGKSWMEKFVVEGNRQARKSETGSIANGIDFGNGQFFQLLQRTTLVCTNPLDLEVYPPSRDFIVARLINPSGEAFVGQINFDHAPPPFGVHDFYARAELSMSEGEHEKLIKIPFDPAKPPAGELYFSVCQSYRTAHFSVMNGTVLDKEFPAWVPMPPLNVAAATVHVDGDDRTSVDQNLSESEPGSGTSVTEMPSVKLAYRFDSGWKFLQLSYNAGAIGRLTTKEEGLSDRWPKAFGLWLHGDGKGCQARIRFTDATGQTFQPDGPKINWTGWRYVTFPMQSTDEKPLAHWGGADDGVVHYPIKWDSIFLLDNVSRQPVEGEVYLSAPTLIY